MKIKNIKYCLIRAEEKNINTKEVLYLLTEASKLFSPSLNSGMMVHGSLGGTSIVSMKSYPGDPASIDLIARFLAV